MNEAIRVLKEKTKERARRNFLKSELEEAWDGEGNIHWVTFEEWVKDMADNDRGMFQDAAKELLVLQSQR